MIDNDKIKEAKRAYYKNYRELNKTKLSEQRKEWHLNNPGKRKEYQDKYWLKKANALETL